MGKEEFSYEQYNIMLNTIDLILDGTIQNIFNDSVDLKEMRDKIRKYSYIYYAERDKDIIHSTMTPIELRFMSQLYGYGSGIFVYTNVIPESRILDKTYSNELIDKLNEYEENKK